MQPPVRYQGIVSYWDKIVDEDEDDNLNKLRIRSLTLLQREPSGTEVRLIDREKGEMVACYRKNIGEV